jgi:RNA-directed DNA polymerase
MKRIGHLMDSIADMDNLRLAFWKAQKGKEGKAAVERFRADLTGHLDQIRQELLAGKVSVGDYHTFTIFDPKERVICAAAFRERVMQHAIMNVCHPHFERRQIAHSYASRQGKGTYAALNQALRNTCANTYFLKMDVRKYFDSLSHQVMNDQLGRMFKDKRLLGVFETIIGTCHNGGPGRGVPIGNLTSQYLANHYLAEADLFAHQELGIRAYVRYMDDVVMWGHDKTRLMQAGLRFGAFLSQKLQVELKPFCLNDCKKGLPFLGYVLTPFAVRLSAQSKNRFRKKYGLLNSSFENGELSETAYRDRLLPLCAFTEKAHANSLRRAIFRSSS